MQYNDIVWWSPRKTSLLEYDERKMNAYTKTDPDHRDLIYDYISSNPGTHLRKITKDLRLGMGNTQYHLSKLENQGRIRSKLIHLRRHYYPASIRREPDKLVLAFLKQETARDILVYLAEHPEGASQREIANFKNLTPATIHWHMGRLIEAGIVTVTNEGKFVHYNIRPDRLRDIAHLFREYHTDVWTKLSDSLAELFTDLSTTSEEQEDLGGN